MLAPWKKSYDKLSVLNSRDISLLTKVRIVKAMVFPQSCMDVIAGGWAPKNWCVQTVVLEKTLERPLDSKIKPINPKGNQPWIFIGRTDAEAKAPILWSPDVNSQLIGKNPDAGKDWGQEEKRATEDEMVGWHHQLNGHELEQSPGDSEGQGSLAYCGSWDHRVKHDLSDWRTATTI